MLCFGCGTARIVKTDAFAVTVVIPQLTGASFWALHNSIIRVVDDVFYLRRFKLSTEGRI